MYRLKAYAATRLCRGTDSEREHGGKPYVCGVHDRRRASAPSLRFSAPRFVALQSKRGAAAVVLSLGNRLRSHDAREAL